MHLEEDVRDEYQGLEEKKREGITRREEADNSDVEEKVE